MLAFIFTGPFQPTEDVFCRIPLLVCRNKVAKALEWLKLNHRDYADLDILYKNLESSENSPPVVINYRQSSTNKIPEGTNIHDMELENGTEEGLYPFTVHTLTSKNYDTTRPETLKSIAMKHLNDGGKFLPLGIPKTHNLFVKTHNYIHKCFHGFFLMACVALVMKDRITNSQMQSTSNTS